MKLSKLTFAMLLISSQIYAEEVQNTPPAENTEVTIEQIRKLLPKELPDSVIQEFVKSFENGMTPEQKMLFNTANKMYRQADTSDFVDIISLPREIKLKVSREALADKIYSLPGYDVFLTFEDRKGNTWPIEFTSIGNGCFSVDKLDKLDGKSEETEINYLSGVRRLTNTNCTQTTNLTVKLTGLNHLFSFSLEPSMIITGNTGKPTQHVDASVTYKLELDGPMTQAKLSGLAAYSASNTTELFNSEFYETLSRAGADGHSRLKKLDPYIFLLPNNDPLVQTWISDDLLIIRAPKTYGPLLDHDLIAQTLSDSFYGYVTTTKPVIELGNELSKKTIKIDGAYFEKYKRLKINRDALNISLAQKNQDLSTQVKSEVKKDDK